MHFYLPSEAKESIEHGITRERECNNISFFYMLRYVFIANPVISINIE